MYLETRFLSFFVSMEFKEDDLSLLSCKEKDNVLNLLIVGKKEEAFDLLQLQLKDKIQSKKCREKAYKDLSEENIKSFLQFAPEGAQHFFRDGGMTEKEKLIAINTFRYYPNKIEIYNREGNLVDTMEKEDYTQYGCALLKTGFIAKDKQGNYFFSFDAIRDEELVPTQDERERLLRVMPADDYPSINKECKSAEQLFRLLGGKLLGLVFNDKIDYSGEEGSFWSRTPNNENFKKHQAFALKSGTHTGQLGGFLRTNLRSVRLRVVE